MSDSSFKGHAFAEGGAGATTFPVWSRKAKSAILEVPGANQDIIQRFGRKSDTLALVATCTKSELDALYGDVGASAGSLVFHYGTFNAYLDSIDAHEILAADKYLVTLNFVRQ